jgi:exodeoxyribonuclease V beta subunit
VDRDRLVAGLMAVIDTPLGPMFDDRPLRDLKPADRLDEMSFDLTLGEGGGRPSDADLGELLLRHLAPDDALYGWASRLATGPFSTVLAGHLTGSIDLVARVRHPDGVERFVVCDYKTNRLARSGVTPTAENFRPDQLPAAMADADYPLQALLYSVALHRYLRWRLGGTYEPAVHLGGVGYLFVRGMVGPNTPTTDGVPDGLFQWHPPSELIIELSDLLHGRTDDGAAT